MAGPKSEPAKTGETKKAAEDSSKASATGSKAGETKERSSPTTTTRKTPSPPMPLPKANMNHSRPPSTTSVHSNNSGGTRTTATSRRGGRTRSRSPPAMRGSGAAFPPMNADRSSNPSSAAAAAAAAAKAYGHPHRGGTDGEPTKFPSGSYDQNYHGSRSWQGEDQDRPRRSGSYGQSQSIHRLPGGSNGGSGDLYSRHGPSGSYGSEHPYRGGRSGSMHASYEEDRYGDRIGRNRSRSPPSDRYAGQGYYHGSPPEDRASPKVAPARSGSGGMSRVMGTATPIHVPRASEAAPSRHSRSGTPASVFRGRPSTGEEPEREEPNAEEDTPQKILLSLRTPTTSFDEKQPAKNGKNATELPPSPDEPPQIQHTHNQKDFFDPSRSPKGGSIDMAPSFNLFNQSFDSFGDTFNVVGGLDSTLQSTSFGAGPTASGDFSGGNYTQQLLGSSGSGGLTFGMSPVNSFGNGPPAAPSSRRGSNMMVLGGQDPRSASPTQVLGMYQSYSGGGSQGMLRPSNSMGAGPLEDSHLRLSATSFGGAPSLSQNYTRSFGAESSPIMAYNGRMSHDGEGGKHFYIILRRNKSAFSSCTFLLPGLKAALLEAPGGKEGEDDPMMKSSSMYPEPTPQEKVIAQRRVISAVCAFGGTQPVESQFGSAPGQSIFREKEEAPTVTPSSSGTGDITKSLAKAKYDEALPTRYYENENRLSWEFEENPPVETLDAEDFEKSKVKAVTKPEEASSSDTSPGTEGGDSGETKDGDEKPLPPTPSTPSKASNGDDDGTKGTDSATSPSSGADTPKMRYRCKLCGQPKQNHTCPFMQSLARSIGIMVYPSVNAFTAAEPGVVAPPLTEMNNFVNPDDASVADTSASIPSPDRRHLTGPNGSTQVTPESRRSKSRQITSPSSTLSAGSGTPQRPRTPGSSARGRSGSVGIRTPGSASSRRSRKRRHGQMQGDDQGDLLFVEPMELKPEQFRMITPSKVASRGAYNYAPLPLPYAQRKRLSDNLFSLSQKIPQLTKEVSSVLREAREKDMWDLAVAELMTQVVIVSHCHESDSRFDGLRQYLLTLGIAC